MNSPFSIIVPVQSVYFGQFSMFAYFTNIINKLKPIFMDPLDEDYGLIDQSEVPAMPIALRYAFIASLAFIAFQLLLDTIGLVDYSTGQGIYYMSFIAAIFTIIILYIAIKYHRDEELGGYITFGRCVKVGALIGLFSGLIIGVFAFVYHGYIRPDIMPSMLEFQKETWESQGLSEDQIEQAAGYTKMFMSPVAAAISSVVNGLFWNVLISLPIGGVLKKKQPMV